MTPEQVVDRLVFERLQQGLSQREVAERIGCTTANVGHLETGYNRASSLRRLEAWAAALGYDLVLELMTRTEGGSA